MKAYLRLVIILCMASLVLTAVGCSSNNAKAGNGQTTIRFAWWGADDRHKATMDAINLYMKNNPNVKIEAEYGGFDGYREKMVTQLAGGSAPDIMQIDAPWVKDFFKDSDYLVDLNQYKDNLDLKGFDQKFLEDYTMVDNKLLGLPTGMNASGLVFNKDVMAQYNIDPQQDWDWEKLLTEGKKLHDANNQLYLLNIEQDVFVNMVVRPYVMQKTGQQWIKDDYTPGFDQAVLTDAFSYVKKLYDNQVIQPAAESFMFYTKAEQNPKWLNKEIAGMPNWVSNFPVTKKPFENSATVASMPIMKDAKESGFQVRPSQVIAINKKSASVDESVKFLNFLFNDKDAALTLGDVRGLPAVDASRQALMDANKIDPLAITATDNALKKAGTPYNALSNNIELVKILSNSIEEVAYNKQSPEEAAAEMMKLYQDKLEELKAASQKN